MNSVEGAMNILKKGAANRHTAKTEVNFVSSRSHSVLSLTIELKVRFCHQEIEGWSF